MPAKKKPTTKKLATRPRAAATAKPSAAASQARSKAATDQRLLLLICIGLALIVLFYGLIVIKLY